MQPMYFLLYIVTVEVKSQEDSNSTKEKDIAQALLYR